MAMRLHELHPSIVHVPLVLLPTAAIVEGMAVASRSRIRRMVYDRAGRTLWWATAGSALTAGLAGMAASREVRVPGRQAEDAMFVHGIGNLSLVVAAFGVAAWRSTHRAGTTTALLGATAVGAALYTAYLGGELTYGHGVGVKAMGNESPRLLSPGAPAQLARDAFRGLKWLLRRTSGIARRERPLPRPAVPADEALAEPFGGEAPPPVH